MLEINLKYKDTGKNLIEKICKMSKKLLHGYITL